MNRPTRNTFAGSLLCLALVPLAACDYIPGYYTYRAEVGYYNGSEKAWYVGESKSHDACISEAQSYFRSLNTPSNPSRAFSWACRKMQGEEFLDRVR